VHPTVFLLLESISLQSLGIFGVPLARPPAVVSTLWPPGPRRSLCPPSGRRSSFALAESVSRVVVPARGCPADTPHPPHRQPCTVQAAPLEKRRGRPGPERIRAR